MDLILLSLKWKTLILTWLAQWDFYIGQPQKNNTFSPIFRSLVYLLSTKPMAIWSIAPGQFLGGQWVEDKAEF